MAINLGLLRDLPQQQYPDMIGSIGRGIDLVQAPQMKAAQIEEARQRGALTGIQARAAQEDLNILPEMNQLRLQSTRNDVDFQPQHQKAQLAQLAANTGLTNTHTEQVKQQVAIHNLGVVNTGLGSVLSVPPAQRQQAWQQTRANLAAAGFDPNMLPKEWNPETEAGALQAYQASGQAIANKKAEIAGQRNRGNVVQIEGPGGDPIYVNTADAIGKKAFNPQYEGAKLAGGKIYNTESAKQFAKYEAADSERSIAARRAIEDVNIIRGKYKQLIRSGGFTGPGASIVMDKLPGGVEIAKTATNLAAQTLKQISSRGTQMEFSRSLSSVPNTNMPGSSLLSILDATEEAAKRETMKTQFNAAFRKKGIYSTSVVDALWNQFNMDQPFIDAKTGNAIKTKADFRPYLTKKMIDAAESGEIAYMGPDEVGATASPMPMDEFMRIMRQHNPNASDAQLQAAYQERPGGKNG